MIEEKKSNNIFLNENGYCLVKNVFSSEEINKLRKFVLDNHHKNQDIYLSDTKDLLKSNFLSDKFFNILKETIGEELLYFLDSSTFVDKIQKKTGIFHIDARGDEEDPITTEYKVWRIGFYLQDHKNNSGGIKMIKKSHKKLLNNSIKKIYYSLKKFSKKNYKLKSVIPTFKYINIPSEAGDMIVWNGRTHHCGRFKRLKNFEQLNLHPLLDRYLPDFLVREETQDRLVIFQNWALKHSSATNYINYRINQKSDESYWSNNKSQYKNFPKDIFDKNNILIENHSYLEK